jgi:phosphatidylserine/phosphatidylglycerophosphate/cardiolipin synthase-like enzyme
LGRDYLNIKSMLEKMESGFGLERVTGKQIARFLKKNAGINDKNVLFYLNIEGAIKTLKPANDIHDYEFSIDKEVMKNVDLSLYAQKQQDDFYLIASAPPHIPLSKFRGIKPLYSELIGLIVNAEKEICIANPFFDKDSLKKIIPSVNAAFKRNINVKLLLRSDINNKPQQNFLSMLKGNYQAREFGGDGYYLHAKFIISDIRKAYVGSANLTKHSLGKNFELGVIFSGQKVRSMKSLFDAVWNSSAPL